MDAGSDGGPDGPNAEPQRKASVMQRTDTILERIDVEGGETGNYGDCPTATDWKRGVGLRN